MSMYLTEEFLNNVLKIITKDYDQDVRFLKAYHKLGTIFAYFKKNKDFVPFISKLKFEALQIYLKEKLKGSDSIAKDKVFSNPKFSSLKESFDDYSEYMPPAQELEAIFNLIHSKYSFVEYGEVMNGINEFVKKAEEGTEATIDETIESVRNVINSSFLKQIEIETSQGDTTTTESHLDANNSLDMFDDLTKFYSQDIVRVRTGISEFDRILSGGMEAGRLYMFAALSGQGKSLTLINLCRMAMETISIDNRYPEEKKCVVYITLENFVHETLTRFLSCATGVESYILKQGNNNAIKEEVKKKVNEYKNVSLFVKYFHPNTATAGDVLVYLEGLKLKGYKIMLVVADYLDLLKPIENAYSDMYRLALGQITKDLKTLGVRMGCPVATATQYNKSGYGEKEQNLGMIGESAKKIDFTDVIVLLNMAVNEMNFYVAKNRDGISNVAFALPLIKNCYKIGNTVIAPVAQPGMTAKDAVQVVKQKSNGAKSKPQAPEQSQVFNATQAVDIFSDIPSTTTEGDIFQ